MATRGIGFGRGRRGSWKLRLIIAAVIALVSLISYWSMSGTNPVTGQTQRVALSTEQEIAMGLQALPELERQFGGQSERRDGQDKVDAIGGELLDALRAQLNEQGRDLPYPFEFHLLDDDQTINAFALPGGQVFITEAMYDRLTTDGQLAGVLGHEIGHVLERHGAQQLAKQQLTQGLVIAGGVAGGDQQSAQMAAAIGSLVNMKYGREHELESDRWGVRLTGLAGYDPRAMIGVMKVLEEASAGRAPPEFLSTHPKPGNRIGYIEKVIAEAYPDGVPEGLTP